MLKRVEGEHCELLERYLNKKEYAGTKEGVNMVKMQDVVVIDACRTPIGKSRPDGYYANTRADDLVNSSY